MSLPEMVRVKLSSEQAGTISLTQVVVEDMPVRNLVEYILRYTGKDEARIRELLLRGSLVSGGSRFRWTGWEADPLLLGRLLATFPDPDPARPFSPGHCIRAVLRGGRLDVEIPREAGAQKPLLGKGVFWDVLMEVVAAGELRYQDYSYRARADVYHSALTPAAAERIRAASTRVVFSTLRDQIRSSAFLSVDLYAER